MIRNNLFFIAAEIGNALIPDLTNTERNSTTKLVGTMIMTSTSLLSTLTRCLEVGYYSEGTRINVSPGFGTSLYLYLKQKCECMSFSVSIWKVIYDSKTPLS